MTPDVNVLVAASRSDHPQFQVARDWLVDALAHAAKGRPLSLLPVVSTGFLRLVTNGRVFTQATPLSRALEFLQALRTAPGVTASTHGGEWELFTSLCREHKAAGNDITDAWIAASALHHGQQLVTFDRGFRRLLPSRNLLLLRA